MSVLLTAASLSQATLLQTRYIELLTLSGDYSKYLGEMLKNLEQLKVLHTVTQLQNNYQCTAVCYKCRN